MNNLFRAEVDGVAGHRDLGTAASEFHMTGGLICKNTSGNDAIKATPPPGATPLRSPQCLRTSSSLIK
jgi:hypothetical protein